MSEIIKLGIFDVDGTLKSKEGVPNEIHEGIEQLWNKSITTTVMTGRGYVRLRESLGNSYNKTVTNTPSTPIGLEKGGRIADRNGLSNLKYYQLTPDEITDILLSVSRNPKDLKLMAYFPEDIRRRAVLWVPNKDLVENASTKYGHFADVVSTSPSQLDKMMQKDKPCMLIIRPQENAYFEELPSGINVVTNEGFININRENIGKDTGTRDVADILETPIEQVLVAGNDDNDMPLFRTSAGQKIWVSEPLGAIVTYPDITYVKDPQDLGKHLQNISI